MDFQFKEAYNIHDLVRIMKLLRAPDGCPWDRVQTHASLKPVFCKRYGRLIANIENLEMHRRI